MSKTRRGARGIVGVQRAEHQVTGERGVDGHVGRVAVANLTHQDHVGVMPQERTQAVGEGQPDARLHLHLVDAVEVVLHRVLDGEDLDLVALDRVERGVERRGFT